VRHPKDVGDRSTLAIMYALQMQGYPIFVPFGENTRYDLVVEVGGRLRRVQCKTGRLRNGVVLFNACSSYAHHPNAKVAKRDYVGEIDDFAVFCPDLGSVYVTPIDDVRARRVASLRVEPPRNSQRRAITFAAPYELLRFETL
jgi:hypothetical protein